MPPLDTGGQPGLKTRTLRRRIAAGQPGDYWSGPRAIVTQAFARRGITPGWEDVAATDAQAVLATDLPIFSAWYPPAAGGGRWALADIDPSGAMPTAFQTGKTRGGPAERVPTPAGYIITELSVDSRYVAVSLAGPDGWAIWLYDSTTRKGSFVDRVGASSTLNYPSLSGGRIAWQQVTDNGEISFAVKVATIGAPGVRRIPDVTFPSLSPTTLAAIAGSDTLASLRTYDAATLRPLAQKAIVTTEGDTTWVPIALRDKVVWTYVDWHRDFPLGPEVTAYVSSRDLSTQRVLNRIPLPQPWSASLTVQATDAAMTQIHPNSIGWVRPNAIQKPIAGGTAVPVTCDKGGAYLVAADEGTAVVWLSGAAGRVDLVMRRTPAGPCR